MIPIYNEKNLVTFSESFSKAREDWPLAIEELEAWHLRIAIALSTLERFHSGRRQTS